MNTLVGGLDGCAAGWVLVTTPSDGGGPSEVEVVADLEGVVVRLDDGRLSAAAIDIPIGLTSIGPRPCDLEARKLLGRPRSSSVFPAPLRSVLGARTFEEANARSRALSGKGVNKQAFAIYPKIAEVDRFMTPERQRSLVEVHPEVSFAILAGAPMTTRKSRAAGREERLAALRSAFPDVDVHAARLLPGTHRDDVLDAFVAAWSARRWIAGTYRRLGGELDERALRMEMIV